MDIRANRRPLPLEQIKITDRFWEPRIRANRERGLAAVYEQLERTGRLAAYQLDWQPGGGQPEPHVFWDSDVAKWLEGACYSLLTHPDPTLRRRVDRVVDLILSAQGEDGYLNPHFTVVEPDKRWTNLRDQHELYCAGHLIEAALAHHRATGEARFLRGIRRFVDLIARVFGPGPEQMGGYPGHEEIELALFKLYRATREESFLDLARTFIDARGRKPHYFDEEARRRGESPGDYWAKTHAYTQSHKPVREQREVVGHAVRGMYLYSAMADLVGETEDQGLMRALEALWADLMQHKLYLTGGIGPSSANEGFTRAYDLPNRDAYAETCAAIGLVFWARRMLTLDLDGRYGDVMERALYNGLLSGVSLDGTRFFYVNPLASQGAHHRQPFYACSCCPTNVNRFLPALGEYVYGVSEDTVALHLYVGSTASLNLSGNAIRLVQETNYPWDGVVCLRFELDAPLAFTLKLRWPGWCTEGRIYLNGAPLSLAGRLSKGYLHLERTWTGGDVLRLQWMMPVRRTYAHPDVLADAGRTALERGPLVYCLEGVDQPVPVHAVRLPREMSFSCRYAPETLGGVMTITGWAQTVDRGAWGQALYRSAPPETRPVHIRAVPYYAWDNRHPGEMRVWLPEAVG